jgi:MYXO-CTERM domain-containing protein
MTLLSALPVLGDIVVPPPTPPPSSYTASHVSPLPYAILALVAIGMLLLMRRRRSPSSVDRG